MALIDGRLFHILTDSFWKILLPGLTMTIPLTAISFTLALCIAVITALVQFANVKILKHIARFYIWVIRGIPLLVQLYIIFYGLPRLGIVIGPFPAAVIVFSVNEGAYAAETMRAALESIPAGQLEAGYCVGMSYLQTMRRIVLPQALRTAFPPLSNSLIAMIKDTSLAANITVTEMFMVTQRIVARTYEPLALYIEIGLVYLMFSTVLTKLQRIGEKKMNAQGKQRSPAHAVYKKMKFHLIPTVPKGMSKGETLCPMEKSSDEPCFQGHILRRKRGVYDPRGSRQMDMQACPPCSLHAGINNKYVQEKKRREL